MATVRHTLVITAANAAEWTAIVTYLNALDPDLRTLPSYSRSDQTAQRKSTISYDEPPKTDWTPPTPRS